MSVLPDPLHPAVVHFPIVLAVLAPIFAAGALWAIRRGGRPSRAWGVATIVFALLAASSWVAVETGEQQEERVENVVSERPLESHEEAAELFLIATGAVLAVAALGLVRGTVGRVARIAAAAGSVALLGIGWNVGRTGGELVYRHGAASAYTGSTVGANDGRELARDERDEGSDDDH
jgi:uncharacterized membrane protein